MLPHLPHWKGLYKGQSILVLWPVLAGILAKREKHEINVCFITKKTEPGRKLYFHSDQAFLTLQFL